jgi:hypothetical protein
MTDDLYLRDVAEDDLPWFFDFQLDPDANHMAAFTAKDPTDREAFCAHWNKILANPTGINRTIVCNGQVVGSVSSYEESGKPEVPYWIGKGLLGQGHRHAGAHTLSGAGEYHAPHLRPRRPRQSGLTSDPGKVWLPGHWRDEGVCQRARRRDRGIASRTAREREGRRALTVVRGPTTGCSGRSAARPAAEPER